VTENELILSLCKEKGFRIVGTDDELIQKFKEAYKHQSRLVAKAALGDAKALRQLRGALGLKVIT
jgi:hypothetical protein